MRKRYTMMTMASAIALSTALAVGAQAMRGPSVMTGPVPGQGGSQGPAMMMSARTGVQVNYTTLDAVRELASRGPTVLFFAADWCPTCQSSLADFEKNQARLGPVNLVVVDYDRNPELKTRYGVTVQHTFVRVDEKAARVAIWNGGGVDALLRNLSR